ncbi:MAG: enoyl-CoA hydratase-related protein, partial [Candidatus Eisenbacteria bacterium]|nr:enoyl-CoA hydratase-related protein [Candidatus Eisenbacteria bacterium]
MAASVEVLREGAVARVRLNRPERRNAFDEALIAELMAAFESDDVRGDATRVVVVEGAGEHFCAGADAGWMRRAAAWSEEENRADSLRMAQMFASIAACPHPVVARAHGAALGGGAG